MRIVPKKINDIEWTKPNYIDVSKPILVYGFIIILILWICLSLVIELKIFGADEKFRDLRGMTLLIQLYIICGIGFILITIPQYIELKRINYKYLPKSISKNTFFKKLIESLKEKDISYKMVEKYPIMIKLPKYNVMLAEEWNNNQYIITIYPLHFIKYNQDNLNEVIEIVDSFIEELKNE